MMILRDYELKRRRAGEHMAALREAVTGTRSGDHDLIRGEFSREASQYVFRVPLDPVDPDIALTLGDFVSSMRAALNYLVGALVRSTGSAQDGASEFPIYGIGRISWREIDDWWEKDPDGRIRSRLRGTPPGTKAALKQLQPFCGAPQTDPRQHPLFALQLLSNTDKHRRPNLLARGAVADFLGANGQRLFDGPPAEFRVAQPDERTWYTVTLKTCDQSDQGVFLKPAYGADIRLHEPPELFGDVIETVDRISRYMDGRVFPTVARLLPR